MKFFLVVFFICWAFYPGIGQSKERDSILQEILASQPTISFSAKGISRRIFREYKNKFNVRLVLADPGMPYNMMDVIYENEPWAMLLFSGKSSKVGFVLYENLGIKTQCYCLCYTLNGRRVVQLENILLKEQPLDFEHLKDIIRKKDYF